MHFDATKIKLILYPNDILTKSCLPVPNNRFGGKELEKCVYWLFRTLKSKKEGIGIAASQANWPVRAFATSLPKAKSGHVIDRVFFNPEVLELGKEKVRQQEGCLSFPGQYYEIERPSAIKIKYQDQDGNEEVEWFRNYHARVVQHEIDHLDGQLYTRFWPEGKLEAYEKALAQI